MAYLVYSLYKNEDDWGRINLHVLTDDRDKAMACMSDVYDRLKDEAVREIDDYVDADKLHNDVYEEMSLGKLGMMGDELTLSGPKTLQLNVRVLDDDGFIVEETMVEVHTIVVPDSESILVRFDIDEDWPYMSTLPAAVTGFDSNHKARLTMDRAWYEEMALTEADTYHTYDPEYSDLGHDSAECGIETKDYQKNWLILDRGEDVSHAEVIFN